ncbi:TIGR03032 family protein [Sphingomonas sp. So64.6b]|nr:TIGR03032 family protein [Sphingomonas sp. So64.6b]
MLDAARAYDPKETKIVISPGLADWLLANCVSLAFTSYQTGQLVLAGVGPDGRVSFNEQNYARATGLCRDGDRLFVGSMFQIWRLENMLKPGQYANDAYDRVLVPRCAHTVNYVDTHELGIDLDDQIVFVNSRYSCLATIDEKFSFRPLWKPRFISSLAPEDRCHLNGLAMVNGAPAYVSAVSTTDYKDGWRTNRSDGGVIIEVQSGEIVTNRLSMPHSPRVHDGALWALDSGRGRIVRVDRATGALEDVAFFSGFLRGLAFHNGHAIVTVSKARGGSFRDLPLQTDIEKSGAPSICAVMIINLASGVIVESIHFDGKVTELFDVIVLPDVRNPMSLGPATVEMIGTVSFDEHSPPLL